MKQVEYKMLMGVLDTLHEQEARYADERCAQLRKYKLPEDEEKRRRRDQECYNTALSHVRMAIEDIFLERLEV